MSSTKEYLRVIKCNKCNTKYFFINPDTKCCKCKQKIKIDTGSSKLSAKDMKNLVPNKDLIDNL